jgi:hypothetical protein
MTKKGQYVIHFVGWYKSRTDQAWHGLPASASDALREAPNSSKQREARPLPPDLLNLLEDLVVSVS